MGCLENEKQPILMMTVEYYGYVYQGNYRPVWTLEGGIIE